jgi:hypothetical protein
MKHLFISLLAALLAGACNAQYQELITQDGKHNAFPALARISEDMLLVMYNKASSHTSLDGAIVGKYSKDDGASWGEEIAMLHPDVPTGVTGLRQLSSGILLMTAAVSIPPNYYAVSYRSFDYGATWLGPTPIPSQFDGWSYTDGAPLELGSGTILLPLYGVRQGETLSSVSIVRSSDMGENWGREIIVHDAQAEGYELNECWLGKLSNGKILALMRHGNERRIYSCQAGANGRRWTKPRFAFAGTGRPHFVQLPGGMLRAVYRDPNTWAVTVRIGYNRGMAWSPKHTLSDGRYVYADSLVYSDGKQYMVYATESPDQSQAEVRAHLFTSIYD